MRNRRLLPFLVIAAFALSCAGTPTVRSYYLMRAEVSDGVARVDPPVAIALGNIEVAAYLMEPGLVLATGPNQVHAARQHLWAEPLDRSLRLYLRAQISNELGFELSRDAIPANSRDFIVDVGVEELHGTLSGAARLVASWRIDRAEGGEKIAEYRFARTHPLARDGYAALADAEVELVRELAVAIAGSLRDTRISHAP